MKQTFHEGELAVQRRTGEAAQAARLTGMITDVVVPGARPFLAQQQTVALATLDDDGAAWASFLIGEPGFVASDASGERVTIARRRITGAETDRAWANLQLGRAAGLVAIDLATRKRLRVNGVVADATADTVTLAVRESYPNCPKYIQRRRLRRLATTAGAEHDDATLTALLARADTMFVASYHPTRGVDASHRGGEPGFLRWIAPGTIRVPDYDGNGMYNTLGNFAIEPRAGLAIVDFAGGRVAQVTGAVKLHFDAPEDRAQPTGGTGRYWDFVIAEMIVAPLPDRFAWELLDTSPFNPRREGAR